uniref:Cytochrome b5 heme-binding domain-containing protein n=1 Tax=Lotharella globosa TaxID=91324 RepID=A0A7S3YH64_9EUKA|mmetsp:Transcript_4216/g.8372  ORF Transcript_4216/g.8372 Transcript_4216/m.8372 type:complete len:286 (+) Transcript_4216:57-914(+)
MPGLSLATRPDGKRVLEGDSRSPEQLPKRRSEPQWFSAEEVAQHNKISDGWIIVEGKVFDITNFAQRHPGWHNGAQTSTVLAIKRVLGTDCTTEFKTIHNLDSMAMLTDYYIGDLIPEGSEVPHYPPEGIDGSWLSEVVSRAFAALRRRKSKTGSTMAYLQRQLRLQHQEYENLRLRSALSKAPQTLSRSASLSDSSSTSSMASLVQTRCDVIGGSDSLYPSKGGDTDEMPAVSPEKIIPTSEYEERDEDDSALVRRSMAQAFGLALVESRSRLFQAFFSFSFFW